MQQQQCVIAILLINYFDYVIKEQGKKEKVWKIEIQFKSNLITHRCTINNDFWNYVHICALENSFVLLLLLKLLNM